MKLKDLLTEINCEYSLTCALIDFLNLIKNIKKDNEIVYQISANPIVKKTIKEEVREGEFEKEDKQFKYRFLIKITETNKIKRYIDDRLDQFVYLIDKEDFKKKVLIKNAKKFYIEIKKFINAVQSKYKIIDSENDEIIMKMVEITPELEQKFDQINKEIRLYNEIIDYINKKIKNKLSKDNIMIVNLLFNDDKIDKKIFDFFLNLNKEKLDEFILEVNAIEGEEIL